MSTVSKMIALFILTTLALAHDHSDHVHHKCIHNEIAKKHPIHKANVKYENHHSAGKNQQRRELLSAPIRLRPYFDPSLPEVHATHIKNLIGASIDYFEQMLSVEPVSGPLLLQRHCVLENPVSGKCEQFDDAPKCGNVDIPKSHFAPALQYGDELTVTASGNGISEADMVIYVSYGSDLYCGESLAYAGPCYADQSGRPIAGFVHFCPSIVPSSNWREEVMATLHELTHAMIMSPSLWEDIPGAKETIGQFDYIVSSNVKAWAAEHFQCFDSDVLPGLQLEDFGAQAGSHWEETYTNSDFMVGTKHSPLVYVSAATLNFMVDSGWYSVDMDRAEPFYWGKEEGCAFFEDKCVGAEVWGESTFPQYFCDVPNAETCNFNYKATTECVIYSYDQALSWEYQYFTNAYWGGYESASFCPIPHPISYSNRPVDYVNECMDARGSEYGSNMEYGAVFRKESRCTSIAHLDVPYSGCFEHECFGYDAETKKYEGVYIHLGVPLTNVTCFRDDALTDKSFEMNDLQGLSLNCPNIDPICGESTQPFACQHGFWSDSLDQCVCHTGYGGSACGEELKVLPEEAKESTVDLDLDEYLPEGYGDAPSEGEVEYAVCVTPDQIEYVFAGMHNEQPYYQSAETGFVLYWEHLDSVWRLGTSLSYYSYQCQTGEVWVNNLEDCNAVPGWDVVYCGETAAPTQSPSVPTASPSSQPSFSPTTRHPSLSPSSSPTPFPSSPTHQPSILPTHSPSPSPSSHPTTLQPSIPPSLSPSSPSPTTPQPSIPPSPFPSSPSPTPSPSNSPLIQPPNNPSFNPSPSPSPKPTPVPTKSPLAKDETSSPSLSPSSSPTYSPSQIQILTQSPSNHPSPSPTKSPLAPGQTSHPSSSPTPSPSNSPSIQTPSPSKPPSPSPTKSPLAPGQTAHPSSSPTLSPSSSPPSSSLPSPSPIISSKTNRPTKKPTVQRRKRPTNKPTESNQSGLDGVQTTETKGMKWYGVLLLVLSILLLIAIFAYVLRKKFSKVSDDKPEEVVVEEQDKNEKESSENNKEHAVNMVLLDTPTNTAVETEPASEDDSL